MSALNARPTSQRSPRMLVQRTTTASTGVVLRFCSALATPCMELMMKEALCIQSTPADSRFNRDSGYELPDCWFALNRKLRGGAIVGHCTPLARHMHAQHYVINRQNLSL